MVNFNIKAERTGHVVDTRWRTSAHGEDAARPGQIVPADFSAYTGLVNPGYIPSGVAVYLDTATNTYKPFTDEVAQTLAGYINDDDGVEVGTGDAYSTVAILIHGGINPTLLPVAAQRTIVADATTTGVFFYTEV